MNVSLVNSVTIDLATLHLSLTIMHQSMSNFLSATLTLSLTIMPQSSTNPKHSHSDPCKLDFDPELDDNINSDPWKLVSGAFGPGPSALAASSLRSNVSMFDAELLSPGASHEEQDEVF